MSQRSELQRIEAFSDAVFAIACTLLVIEIAVPHLEDVRRPGALWPALKSVLPSLVAYLNVCWLCILRPVRLLAPSVSKTVERKVTIQTLSGFAFYLCTTALSCWYPVAALIIISGVQVLWIVMSVDEKDPDATTDLHPLHAVESTHSEQIEPSTPVKAHGPWLSTIEV